MPFRFTPFPPLPRVILIDPPVYADERGWFAERYKASEFAKNGIPDVFVQDNHSFSAKKGTLRGLHYQNPPMPQGKLVHVPQGEILDVVVDIRKGSPTFGRHVSTTLSAENRCILWVPPGFLHGVLTLSDDTVVVYKVTSEFSKEHDRSIRWDDPALGIKWPLQDPNLSQKDREAPLLRDADNQYEFEAS
ncbi:MAG TPA: dTDP-4-dehydrorhamnose 3,5-epimerase [Candidatus Thermoplasmatota archaeon]